MRFKKGSKVEVFNKNEAPSGAWRCAEIISGNGHTYSVKYDCSPGTTNEATVERASRKAIRPCPPPVIGVERWTAGEMVEVFDDLSWKIATVLKDMGGNYYLVRLLGTSREFRLPKVNIRVRQSWQDDTWFVIGKGSGSEFARSSKITTLNCYQKSRADGKLEFQPGDNCLAVQNNTGYQKSNVVSAGTLKRVSPFCSAYAESWTGNSWKIRAIKEEGERQRVMSLYPSLLNKVDAVAYPREILGETYMHASSNNRTNEYYAMERGKSDCVVECLLAESSEANDSDIDACSVGSCSVVSYNQGKMSSHVLASPSQDADTLSGDPESFYDCGDEEKCTPLGEDVAARIYSHPLGEYVAARLHRLELHAYRSTLEALYASGPLSWEQETLLTNLRLSLNISNDEHLMELRNLISSGTSLHISR